MKKEIKKTYKSCEERDKDIMEMLTSGNYVCISISGTTKDNSLSATFKEK